MLYPILVVEDDPKIGHIVKAYLEAAGFRVIRADCAEGALEAAQKESLLLVVLDLMLPGMSGEELCLKLKELGDTPIIILTAKASEEERVAGFSLGADDYVVKPFSPKELVMRVKAVLKRSEKRDAGGEGPVSFNAGSLVVDSRSYKVTLSGRSISLTSTEFKVLLALAGTPGRVFTRSELVEKALGYQFEGYERSVDAHVKNIRRKLDEDPQNPTFIHTVYGVGYRFSGNRDA